MRTQCFIIVVFNLLNQELQDNKIHICAGSRGNASVFQMYVSEPCREVWLNVKGFIRVIFGFWKGTGMKERKRFGMFVLIAGLAAVTVGIYCTRVAFADTVPMEVKITPENLKLSAEARAYVNCHAKIPEAYSSADIKDCSLDVLGTGVDEKKWKICDDPQYVVVLFDCRTVCSILADVGGGRGKTQVTLTLSIEMEDGTILSGSDKIKVSK
jgi:hypothetical protein